MTHETISTPRWLYLLNIAFLFDKSIAKLWRALLAVSTRSSGRAYQPLRISVKKLELRSGTMNRPFMEVIEFINGKLKYQTAQVFKNVSFHFHFKLSTDFSFVSEFRVAVPQGPVEAEFWRIDFLYRVLSLKRAIIWSGIKFWQFDMCIDSRHHRMWCDLSRFHLTLILRWRPEIYFITAQFDHFCRSFLDQCRRLVWNLRVQRSDNIIIKL